MESNIDLRYGDCIEGMKDIPDETVHCCITSIPFGALFSYSHKSQDIGNNLDGCDEMHGSQFGLHMRFFIEQLYRVLRPGSVACIHVQQLLRWKVQHGYMGMRDFRGAVISLFMNHGFQAHGEVAIVKNPQTVAQRSTLHNLMFVTAYRDSRTLAPAMNDYVLFFRKPGGKEKPVSGLIDYGDTWLSEPSEIIEYDKPINDGVVKTVALDWRHRPFSVKVFSTATGKYEDRETANGNINENGWFTKADWVKWAHGAWTDIQEIDTLDGWRCARDSNEEKHVCPLQLEVIRRCMKIYTAPGQTVLDPFMGIGSTAWVSFEQGRDAIGFELKEGYHRISLKNLEKAKRQNERFQLELELETANAESGTEKAA